MPDPVASSPAHLPGAVVSMLPPASLAPAGQLQARSWKRELVRVLVLTGDCDLAGMEVLREALGAGSEDLVVDLLKVTFCDAGCADVLLSASRRSRVVLAGQVGITARVLDLLVPRAVLPRYPTVGSALRALAVPAPAAEPDVDNAPVAATGPPMTRSLEEPFDRLARLAARALGVPFASVTIREGTASLRGRWFGSLGGDPRAELDSVIEELNRAILRSGAGTSAGDTASDERSPFDSSLAAKGVRAWAGMPVCASTGKVVGAFCVADLGPREWTDGDHDVLAALADAAAGELALRGAADRADETAAVLQRSMLTGLPNVDHIQLAARYLPASTAAQIGGDWYDSFLLPDGVTTVVVGDVTGHDLPAAARMGQLRNLLRGIACYANPPPHAVLSGLDTVAYQLGVADLVTAVYGRIEGPEGGPWQLRWANAGHPPPLLITSDGVTRFLDQPAGLLLGLGDSRHTDGVAVLPPLSTLLLYTDGLVESRRRPIDVGLDLLRAAAAAAAVYPLEQFCDHLLAELAEGGGEGNEDDVTLLALRVPPRG